MFDGDPYNVVSEPVPHVPLTKAQQKKLKLQEARRRREMEENERREMETSESQMPEMYEQPGPPIGPYSPSLLPVQWIQNPPDLPPTPVPQPYTLPPPPFRVARAELICQVHLEILNGGQFADTDIHLYSRRNCKGVPYAPRVLALNKRILEASSSEFEKYVFAEGVQVNSDEYHEDSDFEDEEEDKEKESDVSGSLTVTSISESDYQELQTPRTEEDITTRLGDPDLLTDDEEDPKPEMSGTSTPARGSQASRSTADQPRILDGAFKTWQAMSLYLYTDHIKFNPLRSFAASGPQEAPQAEALSSKSSYSPCSPKSLYRLADRLKLPELTEQAKVALKSYLTEDNVVDELFSDFTWRYPDVLQMETEAFYQYSSRPSVTNAMKRTFAKIASGQLPHSHIILESLFGKLVQSNGPTSGR